MVLGCLLTQLLLQPQGYMLHSQIFGAENIPAHEKNWFGLTVVLKKKCSEAPSLVACLYAASRVLECQLSLRSELCLFFKLESRKGRFHQNLLVSTSSLPGHTMRELQSTYTSKHSAAPDGTRSRAGLLRHVRYIVMATCNGCRREAGLSGNFRSSERRQFCPGELESYWASKPLTHMFSV